MKATGIIRRMDDLGRVGIPREVRRALGIREGSTFEIYITDDGGVCFLPYKDTLSDNVKSMKIKIENLYDFDYAKRNKILNLLNELDKLIQE